MHPDPDPATTGSTPGEPLRQAEAVFRENLAAFARRTANLCELERGGRLCPDACFTAITQLWVQLARAHARLQRAQRETGEDSAPASGGADEA